MGSWVTVESALVEVNIGLLKCDQEVDLEFEVVIALRHEVQLKDASQLLVSFGFGSCAG